MKQALFVTLILAISLVSSLAVGGWAPATALPLPLDVGGRSVDVFTQRGGVGSYRPSGSFLPQEEVFISALAMYNYEPLPYRLVAFDVYYPWGELHLARTGATNETGVATISFQLPWLSGDPGFYVGIWTVNAVMSIASETVSDALVFGYGILLGDVNHDGIIDIHDCVQLALAFGATPSDPAWDLDTDVNRDSLVDVYDLIHVSIEYGSALV